MLAAWRACASKAPDLVPYIIASIERRGCPARRSRGSVEPMSNSRLEALKAMAEKKPDRPMINYGLGLEYKKAGDREQAVEAFRAVVRANPSYTAAYQELGALLLELG